MIVLRMNLVLFASLLLITLLSVAKVASFMINEKAAERNHYPKYKRITAQNAVYSPVSTSLLSTSCNKTLCSYLPKYPTLAINKAVNRLSLILISNVPSGPEMRKRIDPIVINYFSSLQHVEYKYDLPGPDGCDHYLNMFFPEEGYSAVDEQTYYIVNLPRYRQRVQSVICTTPDEVCSNDFAVSTCRQSYREEKLLALPIDNEFDVSDFRVKKFKVPNGCVCSKPAYGKNDVYMRPL